MPYALNNGVKIYYEAYGEASHETVLLIEGFTAQLVGWRPGLVSRFLSRRLRIVLIDNRDVGLSDKLGDETQDNGGYTMSDMARDIVAVADDLQVDTFHIVGQSMGGMIAQTLLAEHPNRIRSATLFYTTPKIGTAQYMRHLDAPQVGLEAHESREAAIDATVARERVSTSPGYAFDEAWARELATLSYDRSYAPAGFRRQQNAMKSFTAGRDEGVLSEVPAAIFHGTDDAYMLPEAALALHRVLPNSELHIFPGMGHELVEPLWDTFADGLERTVRRGSVQ